MTAETALVELFLLIIAGLLGTIAFVGRKYLKQIVAQIDNALKRLDKQEKRVEDTREDIRDIKTTLSGEKGTPWDGYVGETKKNARKIQSNREEIQANRKAIKQAQPTVEFNEMEPQESYHDDWTG